MRHQVHGVSADALAAGLITACRLFSVPPQTVFDAGRLGARKARSCVSAALQAAAPQTIKKGVTEAFAGLLSVNSPDIAASSRRKLGITTDHLMECLEAMKAKGLDVREVVVRPADRRAAPVVKATPVKSAPCAAEGLRAPLQRGPIANTFDPATLGSPRRKPVATAPARRRDSEVRYDTPGSTKPLDLGPGDAELVRECRRQGGFPVVFEFKPAQGPTKIFWLNQAGQNWKHRR